MGGKLHLILQSQTSYPFSPTVNLRYFILIYLSLECICMAQTEMGIVMITLLTFCKYYFFTLQLQGTPMLFYTYIMGSKLTFELTLNIFFTREYFFFFFRKKSGPRFQPTVRTEGNSSSRITNTAEQYLLHLCMQRFSLVVQECKTFQKHTFQLVHIIVG